MSDPETFIRSATFPPGEPVVITPLYVDYDPRTGYLVRKGIGRQAPTFAKPAE